MKHRNWSVYFNSCGTCNLASQSINTSLFGSIITLVPFRDNFVDWEQNKIPLDRAFTLLLLENNLKKKGNYHIETKPTVQQYLESFVNTHLFRFVRRLLEYR